MKGKKILYILFLCILLLSGCSRADSDSGDVEKKEKISAEEKETSTQVPEEEIMHEDSNPFELHMLDVGQGLCILMRSGDHYMLYDGGGRLRSRYVVAYLKEHEITSLDYIVASHYDEDHISGLVGAMNIVHVNQAITPDYVAASEIYQSFRRMEEKTQLEEIHAHTGDTFVFGDAMITVLSPESYDYEKENNNSIVIKVTQGDFSCLLTGDAEEEVETKLLESGMDLSADVYIAGHHGSSSSNSEEFVKAVSPEYALISVGAGNSYGHPTEQTLQNLDHAHAKIYRTDLHGEIDITYKRDVEAEKASDSIFDPIEIVSEKVSGQSVLKPGSDLVPEEIDTKEQEETVREEQGEPQEEYQYVINSNTGVFHEKNCKSVLQMSEKNKVFSKDDRETIMEQGYQPCGNCHP